MDIAGHAAFLAPEVVRCRRGCVTFSTAGALVSGAPCKAGRSRMLICLSMSWRIRVQRQIARGAQQSSE